MTGAMTSRTTPLYEVDSYTPISGVNNTCKPIDSKISLLRLQVAAKEGLVGWLGIATALAFVQPSSVTFHESPCHLLATIARD